MGAREILGADGARLSLPAGFDDALDAAIDSTRTTPLTRWQPTEQGDGWRLVGKHDTEVGPVALFIRPLPKAS